MPIGHHGWQLPRRPAACAAAHVKRRPRHGQTLALCLLEFHASHNFLGDGLLPFRRRCLISKDPPLRLAEARSGEPRNAYFAPKLAGGIQGVEIVLLLGRKLFHCGQQRWHSCELSFHLFFLSAFVVVFRYTFTLALLLREECLPLLLRHLLKLLPLHLLLLLLLWLWLRDHLGFYLLRRPRGYRGSPRPCN